VVREYRYAGPDGEGIPGLPPGTGAAIGSEYCVHLLPGVGELEKAILLARDRRAPLLLLTPYFRDAELKKSMALFRAIPEGADVPLPHGKREGVARGGFLFLPPREAIPAGGVRGGRIPRGCARVGKPRIRRPRGRGTGLLSLSSRAVLHRDGVRYLRMDRRGILLLRSFLLPTLPERLCRVAGGNDGQGDDPAGESEIRRDLAFLSLSAGGPSFRDFRPLWRGSVNSWNRSLSRRFRM
jgi:hypothetical protein